MNILDVNFGLVFWTIVNFGIFFLILMKFGSKPIANALRSREDNINNAIASAEKANEEAKRLLQESESNINNAQVQANEIINMGKSQVEQMLNTAKEEASIVKERKIQEAVREINQSKEAAIRALQSEVAGLVIQATEKVLGEKIDNDKDLKLIENSISSIDKISNN